MEGIIRCAVVAGLFCGCEIGHIGTPPDGPSGGTSGLDLRWTSRPATWPGTAGVDLTIEDARLRFDSLRAIGDAGPGDPRTTATRFEVRWNASAAPDVIKFQDAPVGLYSQLALVVDGNDFGSMGEDAYELRGHVVVGGTDYEWRIDDADPLPINLGIEKMLKPDSVSDIAIEIDFGHALEAIKWDQIMPDMGRLEVDEGDTEIIEFRKKLVESFKTSSPSTGAL